LSAGYELRSGLRAVMELETYVGMDQGAAANFFSPSDPFWGRASTIGLETDFGAISLGRNKNPFYYAATENNAFGESYFSPALTVAAFRRGHVIGRAHDNSLRYSSPSWGGFTAAALWSPKEDMTNGDDMSATFTLVEGPWLTVLGFARAQSGLTQGKQSSIALLASNYDFGAAKLFVELASQRDTDVRVKSKAWDVGLTAPLGAITVRASTARIRQTDLEGGNAATEHVASVGADYTIAPGWTSYAGLKRDRVKGVATGYSAATGVRWQF
jgi:predicted porin